MKTNIRNNNLVVFVLLTFFVISFLTNVLGALNPSASLSFGLTETMAGFLPFSFFIAYGLMSIPAGILLETHGERKMLVSAFLMSFLGSILFVLLPTFEIFLLSLFTIGCGMAILQVVINPLLRVSGGEEHYAFNSVLGQLCFGAAAFLSPYVYSKFVTQSPDSPVDSVTSSDWLSQLFSEELNWVLMYALFAALSLLMVVVVMFLRFPSMELRGEEKMGTWTVFKKLIHNRIVILYFLGIFTYVGTEQGISYWMSKFLQNYHGLDFETVGAAAVGNFWGLMTLGGLLGLVLLKVLDSKLVLRVFTGISILCLVLALFAPVNISLYSFQACGFFMSVMYPIIISLALNSFKEHHGSFTGILMSGIMGGAVMQLLIGFIIDHASLKTGMLLNFIGLAFIFSIGIWAKPLISNKTFGKVD
ncbi:MFS transporter [Muricauda sp. JGD-17]|uniref:MFS transporter n=1 Tax=Flagellimonas ochracea TaxID=2696472 RepID=A0A964TDC9_9FLAO|nr:MFS transporter [Allomuricauda ochracea]NAY92832.1 MFS transporter [Allomuricauda ochracea]